MADTARPLIGSAFRGLGWDEARSLGMTTATVGLFARSSEVY